MQLYSADINILRDQNLEPNPLNAGAEEASVLLEFYARNGYTDSIIWGAAQFATATADVATAPDGTMTAYSLVEDTNNVFHKYGGPVSNLLIASPATFTVFCKAGTRTRCWIGTNFNGGSDPAIVDLTNGTFITTPASAICTTLDQGNGWWRIDYTFVVGAEQALDIGPVATNVISYAGNGTGSIFFWQADNWMQRAFGSSHIVSLTNQAGSPVPPGYGDPGEFNFGTGRFLDSPLQIPFTASPQEMSGLLEFVEKGTSLTAGAGLWSIGDYVLATPSLQIGLGATGYQIKHISGGTVSSVLTTKPTIGNLVRLRFSLNADGSVQIWQSINGAAETTPGASGANSLGVAWSEGYSWLNGLGAGNQGFVAFRQMVVLPGANISQADLLTHFT